MSHTLNLLLIFLTLLHCSYTEGQTVLSGKVTNTSTSPSKIEGATVSLEAQPDISTVTDANGDYALSVPNTSPWNIIVALPYASTNTINYLIKKTTFQNSLGAENINLSSSVMPTEQNDTYLPIKSDNAGGCGDCHQEKYEEWSGTNVDLGTGNRALNASVHARAAEDPWVLSLYNDYKTTYLNNGANAIAGSEDDLGFCGVCHAPNDNPHEPHLIDLENLSYIDEPSSTNPLQSQLLVDSSEGVSCSSCHQIAEINGNIDALHLLPKVGGLNSTDYPGSNAGLTFPGTNDDTSTHEYVWGPLADSTAAFMQISYQPTFKDSLFCASCHQYTNPYTDAPGQNTYREWLASSFATSGNNFKTCQTCHMPAADSTGYIANNTLPDAKERPASQIHSHAILESTGADYAEALNLSVGMTIEENHLVITTHLKNQGLGHDFPTGVGIRNAILLVDTRVSDDPLIQVDDSQVPWWANDNIEGIQDGDYAGQPGRGYAKVLIRDINGEITKPVLFIEATGIDEGASYTLASGETDTQRFIFEISPTMIEQTADINVQLLYRRAWRATAVEKGWVGSGTPGGNLWQQEIFNITANSTPLPLFQSSFETLSD